MRLIGHIGLEEKLRSLVESNSVNRTFLFLGQRDSGKTFCGKFFASLILDNRVFRDAHPDFFYFKGFKGKYVELLQEFLSAVERQPFESKHVVVFFDDIDKIPLNSLNVLLKTLEEPPSKTTIIISALSQETLLDTVISRSFRIPLASRTREQKEEILFDLGVRDGSHRLAIIDDLKKCLSKDFALIEAKAASCHSYFQKFISCPQEDLYDAISSCLDEVDMHFFFDSVREERDSLEFKLLIHNALLNLDKFNNKFVLLFNFVMDIRNGS